MTIDPALLDELARVFVQAAADGLMRDIEIKNAVGPVPGKSTALRIRRAQNTKTPLRP